LKNYRTTIYSIKLILGNKYRHMFFLRFASFFVLPGVFNYSFGQSNIDVQHYRFEIEVSDKSDVIKGRALIAIRFLQPTDKFILDLVSVNKKGKGMVTEIVRQKDDILPFNQSDERLAIMLKSPAAKGDAKTFEVIYHGIPADGLLISTNRYGNRTFFADNWPNRAHHWIPCKDELDDKATFEFLVTAPRRYTIISNGRLEEEKSLADDKKLTHWTEDVALPTKVMVFGAANFAVKHFEDSPPGVPISAWTYAQDSSTGFRNYAPASAIVKFYSEYIGPYPYNKLANVQSSTKFSAMENASAIFYNEGSAEAHGPIEDLLAHEIAHQWFGDMVSEKNFAHLWLSEGFATYFCNLYLESKYGRDSMNNRLKEDRGKIINFVKASARPVVDSVSSSMALLSANSYERGSWVLHMLRTEVGDSAFRMIIRKFYDQYKGKNADTDDLKNVARDVTGKDMDQFFKQWLYSSMIPRLDIRSIYNKETEEILVTVTQLQKETFKLPLQLKIESQEETRTTTVLIEKQAETFKLKAKGRFILTVDPETSLLFEQVRK